MRLFYYDPDEANGGNPRAINEENDFVPLECNQLEIRVWQPKKCCSKAGKALGHAAIHYKLDKGGRYYISFYKQEHRDALGHVVARPPVHRPWWKRIICCPHYFIRSQFRRFSPTSGEFKSPKADYWRYRDPQYNEDRHKNLGGLAPRKYYQASYYRVIGLSPKNLQSLHDKLERLLGGNRNQYKTSANAPPTSPNRVEHSYPGLGENKLFKLYACVSFSAICTDPISSCISPKNNCTSILVNLLDAGDLKTDLSSKFVWGRFFSFLTMGLSLGYTAAEAYRIFSPFHKDEPADEVLGLVTTIVGGGAVLGYWFLYSASYLCPIVPKKICCHSPRKQLQMLTRFSGWSSVVVAILALITFTVHALTTPNPFDSPELTGLRINWPIALGVAAAFFFITNSLAWWVDWQNGCTNPKGLASVLNRASEKRTYAQLRQEPRPEPRQEPSSLIEVSVTNPVNSSNSSAGEIGAEQDHFSGEEKSIGLRS